jgi:ATP/maltotriose-dependent transcriptional regulator MalT
LKEFRPAQITACSVRLADLKRRQGKWNEAEKLLNQVESHPLKLLFYSALYYDKEEYENALNMAEKYLRRISLKEKVERTMGAELLLRIYIKLGKIDQAQELLNELKDIAVSINILPLKAAYLSAEGNMLFSLKEYKTASQNLEDAIDIYDKIKLPFESSRNRMILSEVLIKLDRPAQAEGEINLAAAKFKELGAEKDFEKAKQTLKNLYKDNLIDSSKNKYEFTGRELEILRLISEGKNNEEIAEKLFLSIRTVEKHLTNIYSKLGVSGKSARTFAASYAIKNKLILT